MDPHQFANLPVNIASRPIAPFLAGNSTSHGADVWPDAARRMPASKLIAIRRKWRTISRKKFERETASVP